MPKGWKDFTVPISIEAVTVETLPIDIKAQTVTTLAVDIKAQTLSQLNVNIAASAVTLNVNIAAQAANLNIDVKAQSVAVKLVPDWGAIAATDVDVLGRVSIISGSWSRIVDYTVPTGKTLLVYDWSISMYDGDGQVAGQLYNVTDGVYLSTGGGLRGFQTPLSKPKRVAAGKMLAIYARQDTGASRTVEAHFGGTLI